MRQGYVVGRGRNVMYPALQADAAGRAAMVFTLTGATRYPSAAFAMLTAPGANFGAPTWRRRHRTVRPGATRWGDYSWAVLVTDSDAVWLATEYIPPVGSQTSTRQRNWGTRFVDIPLG